MAEAREDETKPVGRPKICDKDGDIADMLRLGFSVVQISKMLKVSRPTVYRLMNDAGIYRTYNEVDEASLDDLIREIKRDDPNAGEIMVMGHLRAKGFRIQRQKVRDSIHRVDPDGVVSRGRDKPRRRQYDAPCPNYVWHIDGNHKLIRWKIVTHMSIDGFSRVVTFAEASDNNRADTVLEKFQRAVSTFGRPIRVRSDHGGENIRVWEEMIQHQGVYGVIAGKSVQNQRVERLNGDLNRHVNRPFSEVFHNLEFRGELNPKNDVDLFCLHYVYLPRINKAIENFTTSYNCHSLSSERNATPLQLFWANQSLIELHRSHEVFYPEVSVTDLLSRREELPYVVIDSIPCSLDQEGFEELKRSVDPLAESSNKGRDIYLQTVQFVGNYIRRTILGN